MAVGTTIYGDISPRTAAYAAKDLLVRAIPYLTLEKFGQMHVLPANNSTTIKFRRYESLPLALTPLTEGVTPDSTILTYTDITANLVQYGSLVTITDVITDTHEDPILQESTKILAEQAANTVETIRFNIIKSGTNVMYANGSARTDVNTPISLVLLRRAIRALKAQNARQLTEIVRSTPSYNTQNIQPGYVAICHSDLEADIRGIAGFIPAENYGTISPWEAELGSVEGIRILTTTIFAPWADGGGTKGSMISTTGTDADVYPVLIFAKDAYGLVPLKGKNAIVPTVINPLPSKSDPLGQRGMVSWKTMQSAAILNDFWMIRLEVAATA